MNHYQKTRSGDELFFKRRVDGARRIYGLPTHPLDTPRTYGQMLNGRKKVGSKPCISAVFDDILPLQKHHLRNFFSTVKHSAILSGGVWGMGMEHPDTVDTSNSASKIGLGILGSIHNVIALCLQGEFGIGPQTGNPTS